MASALSLCRVKFIIEQRMAQSTRKHTIAEKLEPPKNPKVTPNLVFFEEHAETCRIYDSRLDKENMGEGQYRGYGDGRSKSR
jgi:hypothetical protein